MGYFIGAMIPIVAIGAIIFYLCTTVKDEHEAKKRLDKLAKRNRDEILGKRY